MDLTIVVCLLLLFVKKRLVTLHNPFYFAVVKCEKKKNTDLSWPAVLPIAKTNFSSTFCRIKCHANGNAILFELKFLARGRHCFSSIYLCLHVTWNNSATPVREWAK